MTNNITDLQSVCTLRDLREFIRDIPDLDEYGEEIDVFIDLGKNEMSKVIFIGRVGRDVLLYPASRDE